MSLAVLGATSVIGLETAKVFARAGHDLLLVSRNTRGIDKNRIKKMLAWLRFHESMPIYQSWKILSQ